jgi:hypothetical protein
MGTIKKTYYKPREKHVIKLKAFIEKIKEKTDGTK